MIESFQVEIPRPRFEALSTIVEVHLILEPDATRAGEPNEGCKNPQQPQFVEMVAMQLSYGPSYHLYCYAKADRLLCCFLFQQDGRYMWSHWREIKKVPEFEPLPNV